MPLARGARPAAARRHDAASSAATTTAAAVFGNRLAAPVIQHHGAIIPAAAMAESIFVPDQATLTCSQIDRIIVGGIHPATQTVRFAADLGKHTGTDFSLQRRELGLINVGGPALVTADDKRHELGPREALYIGQGAKALAFRSLDATQAAKLYFNSAPAHCHDPNKKVTLAEASPGHIDILVNNAGIMRRCDALSFTESDWDDVIDQNLKTVFFLGQAVARQFIAQRGDTRRGGLGADGGGSGRRRCRAGLGLPPRLADCCAGGVHGLSAGCHFSACGANTKK